MGKAVMVLLMTLVVVVAAMQTKAAPIPLVGGAIGYGEQSTEGVCKRNFSCSDCLQDSQCVYLVPTTKAVNHAFCFDQAGDSSRFGPTTPVVNIYDCGRLTNVQVPKVPRPKWADGVLTEHQIAAISITWVEIVLLVLACFAGLIIVMVACYCCCCGGCKAMKERLEDCWDDTHDCFGGRCSMQCGSGGETVDDGADSARTRRSRSRSKRSRSRSTRRSQSNSRRSKRSNRRRSERQTKQQHQNQHEMENLRNPPNYPAPESNLSTNGGGGTGVYTANYPQNPGPSCSIGH